MTKFLFKASVEDATTKVDDTNFKEHYPAVNSSMNWLEFKPFVRQATENWIIPFLGADIYQDLVDYYIANTFDEADLEHQIMVKIQDSIAYFSIYESMPYLNITISDLGVTQKASENNTSTPVNQWRYKESRWQSLTSAFKALDQALAIMEANLSNAWLDPWKTSDEFTRIRTDYFTTTSQLNQYLEIKNSRRNFKALVKYLKQSQKDLKKILGSSFNDEFETKIKNGTALTDLETELADLCRHYLANKALAMAIPKLRLVMDEDGFSVITKTDSFTSKVSADQQKIDHLKMECIDQAGIYQKEILMFLYGKQEETEFATFKNNSVKYRPQRKVFGSDDGIGGIMIN